jgi:hypothetical protein
MLHLQHDFVWSRYDVLAAMIVTCAVYTATMRKEAELSFETLVPLYKSKRRYTLDNKTFFC